MNINKITHSKCPHCRKHGIGFPKIGYRYNRLITCKYCGKKFKVNRALSITVLIILGVLGGICFIKTKEIFSNVPDWICYPLIFILLSVFEYFAPLEEYDD